MKRLSIGLRFRPGRAEQNKLPFGLSPNVRLAQVSGLAVIDRVRAFGPQEWLEMEAFRPGVLIGHATALKSLSEQMQSGRLDLSSVDHAVFVLTNCGDTPVNDTLRVFFWQSFGVPVYELVAAPDGSLLAADCEAQDGWHVQPGVRAHLLNGELLFEASGMKSLQTGLSAELISEQCACGRSEPKIINIVRARRFSAMRRLAATA
jgi:hypothetical protein